MKEKVKSLLKKIGTKLDIVAQKLHLSRKQLLAITGGVVAVIVIALIIIFGFDRVPKDSIALVNANKRGSITEAGFKADFWSKKRTLFSAKWVVDDKPDIEIQNFPQDISKYDTLNFRVKLTSTDDARVMFYFGSENKKTDDADYYCLTTVLEAGKWNDVSFDMSKLVAYGEPLGLDKLTEISIRTKGWRNSAEEGSVIRFGHVYLSGEPVKLKTYNAGTDIDGLYPHFTQNAIDDAAELAAKPTGWPRFDEGSGLDDHLNGYPAEKCTNALYYLTLAVRYNELEMAENSRVEPLYASNGLLCKDAVIQLLEYFLQGGNEPAASPGCFWGHAVMANSLYLIKNTECIYSELSQDTKDRMDWMMKAMAVAGNWGYNDANNYTTGLDLCGNFGKNWNMNYQNTYLSIMLTSSLYFGNEELDNILVNFNYDTYMDQFRKYNFINVIYTWETAGEALMEKGVTADGSNPVLEDTYSGTTDGSQVGDAGGNGKGVKIPFKYTAVMPNGTKEVLTLDDENFAYKMFVYLASKTYSQEVQSSIGTAGTEDYCYILGDVTGTKLNEETGEEENTYSVRKSPFEGRVGMYSELKATDSHGVRSSLVYAYDSFEILTGVYTNMKLFGGWDSSTEEMQAIDEQIYVGNEDLIFRMEYGYHGRSSGSSANQSEQGYEYRGLWYVKDIWKNVICDWEANTKIKEDLNNPVVVDLPDAEPMGGVIEPPAGSLAAQSLYANRFVEESYTSIGKLTTGTVAFDMVIGNEVPTNGAEEYDTVIALMSKGEKETWSNMEMSIQLQDQLVNIRSGSSYARTGFQFEANYRFHTELTFDASKRVYSAKIYQIYPTVGEVYECKDIPFRSSGDIRGYVDSIAVLRANKTSDLWLENVYVNGNLIKGTDVKYENTEAMSPVDKTAPDTMLRVHRDVWREFTDYTKTGDVYYVKRETVVMMAEDKLSDLESLSYYVSKKALSEAAIKGIGSWTTAEHDVACFKIEPYTRYYVYVKAVDSEGNVAYVSKCMMLDPDIPNLTGVEDGKTYCEARTIFVSDKYLASVTINGEEIINKLSAKGTYALEKNSGKLYIIVKDRAGNTRSAAVRLSDEVLTDKVIIDSEDKSTITAAGFTVDEENTFGDGMYAAKWNVQSNYVNFKGAGGDLTDYKTLKFSVKVAPGDNAKTCSFLMFFGSENNADDKLQYYQKLITVKANSWNEFSIDLSDFTRSRSPSWQDIKNVRIYAYNWADTTNVVKGSQIYIGYMYLVAGEEDRVHAPNPTFTWVPSENNTTKHDYMYSCCNTVAKSEPHVKSKTSDNCSVCGQNMNTVMNIMSGKKVWNTQLSSDTDVYYTNSDKLYFRAQDYGFGVKKIEYATSKDYVENDKVSSLKWTTVDNGYALSLTEKDYGLYVYARVTDNHGKVTYVSANPIIYDKVAPEIKGVENGVTYCEPPTMTVNDKYLSKVTVGGKTVTLKDGKYTFDDDCGTKQVVATDKAGNSTTYTVTVSDTLLGDKTVVSSYKKLIDGTHYEKYFNAKESNQGIDVSSYKTLSFNMLVSPKEGTTATKVRVRMALWSHTYYEWIVNVTPGKWQTVTLDLHNPDIVAGSMKLTNVRFFTLLASSGVADVKQGSIVQLQNVKLAERRVHGNTSERAYVVNAKDSSKHDVTYACCNTVVKTEKHTYGTDGKCIYCSAPELSGIKHGTTYCYAPTFTVKDNNTLEYVKVNGEKVTLDDNNKYTLPNKNGKYVIEVKDQYNNVTTKTVNILSTALGSENVIFAGFTHSFEIESIKKLKDCDNFGLLLTSYKTLKLSVNVTSETVEKGTQADLYWRLVIDGSTYYLYHTKVTVGQTNQLTFNLSDYEKTKGNPAGFDVVKQLWIDGNWDNSVLQDCTITTSDFKLTGLTETRQHTYNQEIMSDVYRKNMNETETCINGLDYYKSCVCGAKGTEIFEGPLGEIHANQEVVYTLNRDNVKQHIVTHACCNEVIATEAHDCHSNTTEGATVSCDDCGAEFVDNLDHIAPTITGIENGKTYYNENPTMLVADDKKLDKVTINGVELVKANDGTVKYQFATAAKAYEIVAVDDSGNQTEYTISVLENRILFETDFTDSTQALLETAGLLFSSTNNTVKSKFEIVEEDGNQYLKLTSKNNNSAKPRIKLDVDVTEFDSLTVQFDFMTYETDTATASKKLYLYHGNQAMTENVSGLGSLPNFWTGRNQTEEWQTVKVEFAVSEAGTAVTSCAYVLSNDTWVEVGDYQSISCETDDGVLHLNFLAYLSSKDCYAYIDNMVISGVVKEAKYIAPSIMGVEDGATYYTTDNQTMVVSDSDLESVTIRGKKLEIDKTTVLPSVSYTFDAVGQYEIVAKDKADNTTTYTITVKEKRVLFATDFGGDTQATMEAAGWKFSSTNNTVKSKFEIAETDSNKYLKLTSKNTNSAKPRIKKDVNVSDHDNLTVQFDYKTSVESGAAASKKLYLYHGNQAMDADVSGLGSLPNFWTGLSTEWQTVKVVFEVTEDGAKVKGSAYVKDNGSWEEVSGYQNVEYETDNGVLHLNFLMYLSSSSYYALIDNIEMYSVIGDTAPNITGIVDGHVYNVASNPVMTVTDGNLSTVTVNGTAIDVDRTIAVPTASYTFTRKGEYTIVATDEAGNTTTYNIIVKNVLYATDFTGSTQDLLKEAGWKFSSTNNTVKSKFEILEEDNNTYLKLTSKDSRNSAKPRIKKDVDVSELNNLTIQFDFKTSVEDGAAASKKLYLYHGNQAMDANVTGLGSLPNFWTGLSTEWQTVKVEFDVSENGETVTGSAYVMNNGAWEEVSGYQNVEYDTDNGVFHLNFLMYLSNSSSYAYLDNVEMYTY